jgi:hypothetical protein
MFKLRIIKNKNEWDSLLSLIQNDDIYLSHEYINLFLKKDETQELLTYSDGPNYILVPLVKRQINLHSNQKATYFDYTSAYGYGGPFFIGQVSSNMLFSFVNDRNRLFNEMNIVSEFVRFNPLTFNQKLSDKLYDIYKIGKTIYIKTFNQSSENILSIMAPNSRYSVRKAMKANLSFKEVTITNENLLIFKSIYDSTMKRDNAASFYFFDDTFYSKLINFENNVLKLFMVYLNDKPISSALVFIGNNFGHYFLSGSDEMHLNLSPNNFLIYNISLELSKLNVYSFHLGGGVGGLEDGLFKFKKSFNPKGELDFYLGTQIYNYDIYNVLSKDKASDGKFFFPLYRKP